MSWAQRDKTLQETVTFTDKKKIAYNNSDPGGILPEKLSNLKSLSSRLEELHFSKEVRGQIMLTINNNRRKFICVSRPLSMK